MSEFGQYIRLLRKERNETLHQVSMGTDIDSPMLSKVERGERFPTKDQISKLARHFNVPEEELKARYMAGKFLKDYGANEITYEAVQILNEQLAPYSKSSNKKPGK